ncbi:MAG: ATP-binding protein [Actinomycetota bacterium]|nr:ATP-binding protein [Actinomycetota bacterium]
MNTPIRLRLTAWYVTMLALILAIVAAFVILSLNDDLTRATDSDLRSALTRIVAGYQAEGAIEFQEAARDVLLGEHPVAQILTPSGQVRATYGTGVVLHPIVNRSVIERAMLGGKPIVTAPIGGPSPFRLAASRARREGRIEVIVAGVSLAPVERASRRVLVLLLIALPAALLATAASGWWLARRALRPVDRMATAAEVIGTGRLRDRIAVTGAQNDELAHLARTLNTMLDRIEHTVSEQQRLVADASHELRTPVTVMRSEIDVSLLVDELSDPARKVLLSTREEVDRLSATIDDLLTLATLDSPAEQLKTAEPVNLGAEVRAVADSMVALARRQDVTLRLEGDRAWVVGDAPRIRHAVRNLVENAIKFSPTGGTITVRTWNSGERSGVTVQDEGSGVPEAHRERIFDRFFRMDASRSRKTGGSGLGLAIVREIATAHGGEVRVLSVLPRGSAFEFALPASASGSAHLTDS